ncbi:alpha/beta hydrolase [Arenicella sp. 4NH20-0111]|uniref:alpha/beta fold hydrolase n=1 Tax=Arenicella sp. 4NH20-0111 TaxID=3127648 RepID=UPI00310BFE48
MKNTTITVRGLRTHIQEWGDPSNPTIFMLHGWMDCGATYQYMAKYLEQDFHLVAPDLRGFGETEHAPGYWFPDYLADLEVILDHYAPNESVQLVGHSMGGNIVTMYAGLRPERVGKVLILEALGLAPTEPSEAPEKYRRWMNEILSEEPSKVYPTAQMLRMSIYAGNPTLPSDKIDDLVTMWGRPFGDYGALQLKADHKHRYANPVRYNFDDVLEIWKQVQAKVGLVMADKSWMFRRFGKSGRIEQAKDVLRIADENYWVVNEAAHMLHIEQPEQTADTVKAFFS